MYAEKRGLGGVKMENAIIAFVSIMLLGVVIFVKIWWDGAGISMRFTRWFFALFFVAAFVGGLYTFWMA